MARESPALVGQLVVRSVGGGSRASWIVDWERRAGRLWFLVESDRRLSWVPYWRMNIERSLGVVLTEPERDGVGVDRWRDGAVGLRRGRRFAEWSLEREV